MLRCEKCNEEIPERRIKAVLEATDGRELPTLCEQCATEQPPPTLVGFEMTSGEKGSRKVGAECVILDPRGMSKTDFQEMLRQAIRVYRRAR